MLNICIVGCSGRMGSLILKEIDSRENLTISGAITTSTNRLINKDIAIIIGGENKNILITDNLHNALINTDIIIDFSTAANFSNVIKLAEEFKKPIVSGVTNLKDTDYQQLKKSAQKIPILWAANMSLAVNLMAQLVREAAAKLYQNFDIEILEMHHKSKIDAPSGTAIMLGQEIAQELNWDFNQIASYNYHDQNSARQANTIGFSSIRGGNIAGEHSVIFAGEEEIFKISHEAMNRNIFAKGAVQAAIWLSLKAAGLYTMQDVIKNAS